MTLHTETAGDGPPVVAATGWSVPDPSDLRRVLPETLSKRSITTFHYPGTGMSVAPATYEHSTRRYAEDLLETLDATKGPERAHFVGIGGMGALTMMEFAALAPSRVQALVLHQGWARCDQMLTWQLASMRDLLEHCGFESYQRLAAVLCFTPEYLDAQADDVRSTGWNTMRDHHDTHLRFIDACLRHDARDRLSDIDAPTLVITGDGTDFITGERLVGPLVDGIPTAEACVMAGAPHNIKHSPRFIAQFDQRVQLFLEQHPIEG